MSDMRGSGPDGVQGAADSPGTDVPVSDAQEAAVPREVLDELSRLFGDESGDPGVLPDATVVGRVEVVEVVEDIEVPEIVDVIDIAEDVDTDLAPATGSVMRGTGGPGPRGSGGTARILDFGSRHGGNGPPPPDPLIVIDVEPKEADRATDVDPRFEERRRAWARRDRLKRVRWVKIAGLLAGAAVVLVVVLASPLFAIRSLEFEGTVYTSKATIDRVTRVLKGTSVFTADTSRARAVLLDDPWVADVRISTHFPSSAVVEVSERVPVVWYVGSDNKARMVDARGHVIEVLTGFPTKYLQVKGTGPDVGAGEVADDAYRAAAQLVLALPDEIRPMVVALDLSPAGELSMVLKGDTLVRFGTPTDLQNKLVAVIVLLRRQDPKTIAVVDVSAGEPTVLGR